MNSYNLVLAEGVESLFMGSIYKNKQEVDMLMKHKDIYSRALPEVSDNCKFYMFEYILKYNLQELSDTLWLNFVDEQIKSFNDKYSNNFEDLSSNTQFSKYLVLLYKAKDFLKPGSVDWYDDVVVKLSKICASPTQSNETSDLQLYSLVNYLFCADSKNLMKIVHRVDVKRYSQNLKYKLYSLVIKNGLLDEKTSRRIRSDSSGKFSVKILRLVFLSRAMYSDDDYRNILMQFSDSKHKYVQLFLAANLPLNIVPFFMGMDFDDAKKLLELRMNAND